MLFLVNVKNIIDDVILMMQKAPWYVYLLLILVVLLLLIVMPLWRYSKRKQAVVHAMESASFTDDLDVKIFVRLNRQLIAENQIESVLTNVRGYIASLQYENLQTEIIHLSSRFHAEQQNISMGLKDINDSITMNQIKLSLLEMLEKLLDKALHND